MRNIRKRFRSIFVCVRVYDRPAKAVATLRISFVMCIVCFAFRLLEISSCNFLFSVFIRDFCHVWNRILVMFRQFILISRSY